MITLRNGKEIPLEMHRVKVVQDIELLPIQERKDIMESGGFNTFLFPSDGVFLDMLTDSGTNAMSDKQLGASMMADDAYAGSATFYRLQETLELFFGCKYFLPAHQGRACENIIAETFVKPGQIVPMNYHFTTTQAHIEKRGGKVVEIIVDEGLLIESADDFKGNMSLDKLNELIKNQKNDISFVRMEAGTNLIGGQPFSLENLEAVAKICKANQLMLVLDASLLSDNLYFIATKEKKAAHMSVHDIVLAIANCCDLIYFSARKLGSSRGGGMVSSNQSIMKQMEELIPLYEGFLTYGGMSTREMESLRIGLMDTLKLSVISQGPEMIRFMNEALQAENIPVVTPSGGLGCHLNALKFVKHIPQQEYPAGALAAALYLVSGIRGMERGTLSEARDENGVEPMANMELVRLAIPRRTMTMSQILFAVDRITWLFEHRALIGGLTFVEEPKTLRFFFGRLEAVSDWPDKLMEAFEKDFGKNEK